MSEIFIDPSEEPMAFIDIPLPEAIHIPTGGCKVCGCPPDKMPMVNRGTGWCSELHRKELTEENPDGRQ